MTELVLASASASRARLLRAAGVDFRVDPANIDEGAIKSEGLSPADTALKLAQEKALAVAARNPNAVVLGGDQVLVFQDCLVSKCGTLDEARQLLTALSANSHELISAVTLAHGGRQKWQAIDRVRLRMRPLSGAFIDEYLAREGESLLSGVGCYRMEERGAQLFERIEGDYFSVLGLPLLQVLAALRDLGMLRS